MKPILINLTARVKTTGPRIRRETLNGREYIIVPTRLMVSGVLNGSKGPLFYPREEIGNDVGSWNGMPLVVYHPNRNGENVSARDPEILNTQGVGYVFRANTQNRKGALDAESWFDIEKTRQVAKSILDNIEAGKPIEVSTGLFTRNDPAPKGATHNGKGYDFIARDYRPDHLAILPDQIGACSITDGCGVLVNGGPGSGPSPGSGDKKKGGTLSSLPKTMNEAESLAWATRDTIIGEDDDSEATEGDCNAVSYVMKDLHPDVEIWQGNFDRGEGHSIVKAGDFFIDVTADQFGKQPVKVWSVKSQEAGVHKDYWGFQRSKGEEKIADSLSPGRSKALVEHLKDFDDSASMINPTTNRKASKKKRDFVKESKELDTENALLKTQIDVVSYKDNLGPEGQISTVNGGLGSGKAPELVPLSRNLDEETHGQQPHISPNTLMKAFDSTGFVTTASKEGNGVVIAQNTSSVLDTLKTKGWNHDSYQVKNGERTESMSKGNNRITLCSEGSRTVAYATRGHGLTGNADTTNKESVMTKEEREAVVNTLTTNCKCQVANTFSENDREYLESLEDVQLKKFAANRQALIESEPVINTLREVSGNKTLTANAMPDFIKKKMAAKKKPVAKEPDGDEPVENDDDDPEEPAMNQEKKPVKAVTEAEWLKSAPPSIREVVRNAQKDQTAKKQSLIEKLTANVSEDRLDRLTSKFEAMDIETLEDLVEALPTQNQEQYQPQERRSQRQSNYQGAGAPIQNRQSLVTANAKERQETIDMMTPPTLNYAEISAENANHGRRKKQA